MPDTSVLFQPITVGALQLKNRVVMAPMTRSRSDNDGVPPGFAADYYAQRADAGLIVSEATNISAQARGYALTPGIYTPQQVAAWQVVTRAVHAAGGTMLLQLWHTGRINHPSLHGGALPVAPSAIKPEGQAFTATGMQDHVTPRALETDEIPAIVADYRHAAQCAKDAGFDGVEIHSANNYLLEQFIRDSTNKRTDEYGGSVENRLRFPLAVAQAVTEVWGGDRVGIRISPGAAQPGGTAQDSDTMGTFGKYIEALNALRLMYVHDIEGTALMTREDDGVDYMAFRKQFHGAYIANNGYDRALADKTLGAGNADLISFGRPFLANPDLVERLRTGAPLAEAPKKYWYGGDATGYSDWPAMNERRAAE
ncbi:MAG: alkene reductase [Gemmatimonadaceae bacterium]|nr:alkene reductase [Acetobacteraceae bacterium]